MTQAKRLRRFAETRKNDQHLSMIALAFYCHVYDNATMHLVAVKPEHVFQALGDPTRIRVVRLLVSTGEESCMCELVDSLLEPHYKLSRHVKSLRQAGLLSMEKSGRWVYHRLVNDVPYLLHLYEMVRALPDRERVFARDLQRFKARLCLREGGRCRLGIQAPEFAMGQNVTKSRKTHDDPVL